MIQYDFSVEDAVLQVSEVDEIRWAEVGEVRELICSGELLYEDVKYFDLVIAYIEENLNV